MVKWGKIFSTGKVGVNAVRNFVEGKISIESVQQVFRNNYTEASGELRRVIRERGAVESRMLARKALKRRGLLT